MSQYAALELVYFVQKCCENWWNVCLCLVEELLLEGVNPCSADDKLRSALHMAAAAGNERTGELSRSFLSVTFGLNEGHYCFYIITFVFLLLKQKIFVILMTNFVFCLIIPCQYNNFLVQMVFMLCKEKLQSLKPSNFRLDGLRCVLFGQ